MAAASFGTPEHYPFFRPINIVEAQTPHLAGSNTVHRKYRKKCVISNHRWLVS